MMDTRPSALQRPTSRRSLVAAMLAATIGVVLGRIFRPRSAASTDAEVVAHRLVEIVGLYRRVDFGAPAANSPRRRVTKAEVAAEVGLIMGVDAAEIPRLARSSDDELRTHLLARIADDYRLGNIHSIQGWWLAATESRTLALAAALCMPALQSTWHHHHDTRLKWQQPATRDLG
jgi:hypothetical protein